MNKYTQISVLLLAFLIIVLLPSCGSKGDLYHDKPENPASNVSNEQQDKKQAEDQGQ